MLFLYRIILNLTVFLPNKIIICLLVTISFEGYSQNVIQGTIKDETGKIVNNINLILYPRTGENILGYGGVDERGRFTIKYPNATTDSIRLEIIGLAYERKILFLVSKSYQLVNVQVKTAVNTLPEIIIKDERPITKKSDTINYNIKSFANKNDRVIIDVIKNLPGIKVTESGQILYQNKAINKFYVEGQDLLEGRYNLATNNLPVNAVDAVQILENHQPVKMFEGIEDTDRAALNIKLNANAKMKLMGNVNAGLGLTPFLRNNNLALLKFNKNMQYINTVKNNNVGVNLDKELNDLNLNLNTILSGGITQNLVNIVKAPVPPLNAERYTFNNNTLATSNQIFPISKLFTLKYNIAYENDKLINNSDAVTQIYLPTDTIIINENQSGYNTYHKLISRLGIEANTQKIFFKDIFNFQRIWSSEYNHISSNDVNQKLNNPFINLYNDFSSVIKIKNNLLGVNSYISYSDLPQYLNITPGQYEKLLNNNQEYDGLLQKIQSRTFFSNNTLSIGRKINKLYINNKLGILINLQELNNNLELFTGHEISLPTGSFQNNIKRNQLKLYNETALTYRMKKANVITTLNIGPTHLSNDDRGIKQSENEVFFNYSIKSKYDINQFFTNSLNVTVQRDATYISNTSFVLQNYRSLVSYEIPLYKTWDRSINYSLNYKNIVTAMFANLGISFSRKKSNILMKSKFDQDLITQTAIVQDNPSDKLNLSGNINKYYLPLKTGIDFGINYAFTKFKEIQQETINSFLNKTLKFTLRINTQPNKWLVLNHNLEFNRYKNISKQNGNYIEYDPVHFFNQNFNLKASLFNDYTVKINLEHYYNDAKYLKPVNYLFADFGIQKTLKKQKIDLSATVSNIFNVKNYTSYSYTNNYLLNSNYALRGRILLLKADFQF
ncbi:hypothetical protein [Pedobacter sp.]|uniref:hypothetical protein n=1 Tax=Pedobacter sp. TaxID=1411316 RepID=UPI00396C6396